MRFRDDAAEAFGGQTAIYGTPVNNPRRLIPLQTPSTYYWTYAATNTIGATDGTQHSEILPVADGYSATDELTWNGGAFSNFMVFNNGRGVPLSWDGNLSNDCVPLANWDGLAVGTLADVIRPWRNFLVALRVQESGVYNPRVLVHSNAAATGALPTSWDYTDPNEDNNRIEFAQTTDELIDAVALRDNLVVYKEHHTWAGFYSGGVDNAIQFRQVFSEVGAMSQYCVGAFKGNHVVLSGDDVVLHDLNQAHSLLDRKARRWLFSKINPTYYYNSYTVVNHADREVWICFPESGVVHPRTALVWNWHEDTLGVRDLGFECPHIASGVVTDSVDSSTFDGQTDTFDGKAGPFDGRNFSSAVHNLLMANPSETKLLKIDSSGTFDGTAFKKSMVREALPFGDFLTNKNILRVFPKLSCTRGETVNISIGWKREFMDATTWSSPQPFVVGDDAFVNFRETGRIIDIRFEYSGNQALRLFGFDIEWELAGEH